ncbi:MAG: hypothetical protein NTY88_09680 [Bacteroidetes bacterium]|nr:hypothetical protein [Bacteroidota bacterium]
MVLTVSNAGCVTTIFDSATVQLCASVTVMLNEPIERFEICAVFCPEFQA